MKKDKFDCERVRTVITGWLKAQLGNTRCEGFVVGVSGGIDSAVVSALCAYSGIKTIVVGIPIDQQEDQLSRSDSHMKWLVDGNSNVTAETIDLSTVYKYSLEALSTISMTELADANLQSRLRMCCLYGVANTRNCIVVGTGNKIEDYGIGFFTKYGDGGVDISPIADLLKSEVKKMASFLGVSKEIINAKPTDGLWGDDRSDEDQIGATYEELEWALYFHDNPNLEIELSERQKEVLKIYTYRHLSTKHKLETPPICHIEKEIK